LSNHPPYADPEMGIDEVTLPLSDEHPGEAVACPLVTLAA
jgi:hypothetical protein